MAILGIYDGHNAGAALISEETGRLVAAVEEERFSRTKNHDGRRPDLGGPIHSVAFCLNKIDEPVTRIALGVESPARLHRRSVKSFLGDVRRGEVQRLSRAAQLGMNMHDLLDMPRVTQEQRVATCLAAVSASGLDVSRLPRHYVAHHKAHAASAFLLAPVDQALVLTLDGRGDDLSGSVHHGHGASMISQLSVNALQSLGHLYSAFTTACGLRPQRDEGKLMAMAGSGQVEENLWDWLKETFVLDNRTGGIRGGLNAGTVLGPYPDRIPSDHNDLVRRRIDAFAVEDAAATVQAFLEEFVCRLAVHHMRASGLTTLAVAGGVFANVSLNRRLADLEEVGELHVHPGMTDSGISVGAAAAVFAQVHRTRPKPLLSLGIGPSFEDATAVEAFRAQGYDVLQLDNAEKTLALALSRDTLVARFVGGTEYGPRALGYRSVLAPAHRADLAYELNERLGRSQIMPFAPMVLAEDAATLFKGLGPVRWPTQFMTTAVTCRKVMRDAAPAAVHRDGTARPQVVHEDQRLTELLHTYQTVTGRTAIINTSFNLHDEPIVCTPDDAASSARRAGLNIVQVGTAICARTGEMGHVVPNKIGPAGAGH